MYLLYLDDSGSTSNANEEYLVLGGICVFERQANYFTQALDAIAHRVHPNDPHAVEFHASAIWAGRGIPWDSIKDKEERKAIIKEVLHVFANSYEWARAFACVVHKASYPGQDPMEIAFEDLCSRFDLLLWRLRNSGDQQKGLIILDESTYETTLQNLARDFRTLGTRWNVIHNIADVPLFVDSRASRCVQVADHVAYAVFRHYHAGDTNYLNIILNRFDYDGRVLHGLCHKAAKQPACLCPACLSRRSL
jgi:hypothetical protein